MKLEKMIGTLKKLKSDIEEAGGSAKDSEVVLYEPTLNGFTADIDFSVDDQNNIEFFVVGGAKPF